MKWLNQIYMIGKKIRGLVENTIMKTIMKIRHFFGMRLTEEEKEVIIRSLMYTYWSIRDNADDCHTALSLERINNVLATFNSRILGE